MAAGIMIEHLRPTVAAVWLGMLIGVSFIATPVKFQAAGLDLAVALDVGRLTFGLFALVEWVLAGLLVATMLTARTAWWHRGLAGLLVGILALQTMWLLPALDLRVEAIIAGRMPDPSIHHALYAGLEAGKAVALVLLALTALRPGKAGEHAPSNQEQRSDAG